MSPSRRRHHYPRSPYHLARLAQYETPDTPVAPVKSKNTILPTDDASRQKIRLLGYFMNYFPTAQVAAARHSMESNIKHCGKPGMEWASHKSVGDGEQCERHLFDAMEAWQRKDWNELYYHLTCLKWRSDELLHRLITRMPPFDDESIVIDVDAVYEEDHEQR